MSVRCPEGRRPTIDAAREKDRDAHPRSAGCLLPPGVRATDVEHRPPMGRRRLQPADRQGPEQNMRDLVARALAEDLGSGDVTGAAVVPDGARIEQKVAGGYRGLEMARMVFGRVDSMLRWRALRSEGEWREHRPVAGVVGPRRRCWAMGCWSRWSAASSASWVRRSDPRPGHMRRAAAQGRARRSGAVRTARAPVGPRRRPPGSCGGRT